MIIEALFVLAMLASLKSIRIRREADRVLLSSLDGVVFGGWLVGAAVGSMVIWWVDRAYDVPVLTLLGACAGLFLLASGCRVRLSVGARSAVCYRLVFWVIPWRRARFANVVAWLDGWGDILDPEAFYVGCGRSQLEEHDGFSVELGWSGAQSGDLAERLAQDFNSAVRELRARPGLGPQPAYGASTTMRVGSSTWRRSGS